MKSLAAHPLWQVGFRPFFSLACLSGLALPLGWTAMFSGLVPPLPSPVTSLQWHAHEMFYGFGWALLGGFLLTASKNWVSARGWHGAPLVGLAVAWLLERGVMALGAGLPGPVLFIATNAFLVAVVVMVLSTLLVHRRADTYRADNLFFVVALPMFVVAKNLLLDAEHFSIGTSMTLGLFRLCFLLMLERTVVQFMRGVFKVEILRHRGLDTVIKAVASLLVIESLLPTTLVTTLETALASLLAARLVYWKPLLALTRLDVGIMHLGYAAIVVQLLVNALGRLTAVAWVGTMSVHLFTLGAIGLITPAMLMRIAKGHTGRKVVFDVLDKAALWVMLAGLGLRVLAPQLMPRLYMVWLTLTATCWLVCFGALARRYVPWLLQARVDGKEH